MKIKTKAKEEQKSSKNSNPKDDKVNEWNSMKNNEDEVKKPKKNPATAFSTYIYRVKKQVHPDLKISKSSMRIIESFISDFFDRLCRDSSQLMDNSEAKTLKAKDILAAIKMVLPGELGKHAYNEAEKAINTYTETISEQIIT